MRCVSEPLLDVYERAWDDHEDAQKALHVVGSYLEDLWSTHEYLPWNEWFNPQSQGPMELLCKRLVLDESQRYAHPHAWSSMAHWRTEMLFDPTVAPRLRSCVEDVPEQTWHDLFRLHGHGTALAFTRLLGPTDTEPGILEHTLIKQHKGIVLAMHLGMFTDHGLGREQGLHGQTLHFWAKRMAVVARKEGWDSFCTMYPWAGPILVQRCLEMSYSGFDCEPFVHSWSAQYPQQAQALQMYLHANNQLNARMQRLMQPAALGLEEMQARQRLLDSLCSPAASIAAYMENYRSIFSTGVEKTVDVELPCLEP